ncbi:Alpha/Beta hydrolase protein [Coniochaeta sp. 2T2.1]|nr:Alpha/Beta hydrolase protein [Coniochaeta sp. 2T2.1]
MSLQTKEIPPSTSHTHTVVFLHGRGDNIHSFASALSSWRDSAGHNPAQAFPSFKWVFPQAPVRTLAADPAVSWPQWFDVWSTRDFTLREEMQLAGLREMVPAITDLLRKEADALGGRWDRVVLAGISMGGATAAHALFNLHVPESEGGRLAAYMGFCARCPFAGRGRTLGDMRGVLGLDGVPGGAEVLRKTPVLLEHCVDDPLVKIENGRGLRDTLSAFGAGVEWKEYARGGHWFQSPDGMDDVVAFLRKHVLGDGDAGNGEQSREENLHT